MASRRLLVGTSGFELTQPRHDEIRAFGPRRHLFHAVAPVHAEVSLFIFLLDDLQLSAPLSSADLTLIGDF